MKKPLTLRAQLSILMALIVILQSLGFVMALSVSKVFFMLDSEAIRLLNNTTETRGEMLNSAIGNMVGSIAEETEGISRQFIALAEAYDTTPQALYLNDDAYLDAATLAGDSLISMLENSSVTGAFVILNGSNANPGQPQEHSAVYIRNATPGSSAYGSLTLEVGPAALARSHQMASSVHWDLDIAFDETNARFFTRPIEATEEFRRAEIERYGYWSASDDILKDRQQVITYTMPLRDQNGHGYGVLGFELSLSYFTQNYLPDSDLLYQNSFYAITALEGDTMIFEWLIPGGSLAQVYLRQGQAVTLSSQEDQMLYTAHLEGMGDMYCSVQPLRVYSDNSPFANQNWSLICFVPQAALQETSSGVRDTLTSNLLTTTFIAFCMVVMLVFFFTRKISGLSRHVSNLSPYEDIQFRRTGLREIDDLTAAVKKLNQSVINASKTTSKILELTLLPIGGFEFSEDNRHVILTEYLYELLHISPGALVTKEEWGRHFAALTREPAGEHESVYQYLDPESGTQRWLRILEAKTETETVGVILDVSKDIEENRRLARELDYDGLTQLYNRIAFKREVNQKLRKEPDRIGVMMFADLDNLKYINDTFGHDMGDSLIIHASDLFREFDRQGGIVSRISGDEFAIYLHDFSAKDEARDRIKRQLRRNEHFSLMTPEGMTPIRFSTGLAWYPDDSDNVTDLLKLSDFAMYEAKHKEKGGLYEFSQESYQESYYLLENREAINRLIDEGLIEFVFQPIVGLKTGEIYAYEMLMRPLLSNFKNPSEILAVASAQSKLSHLEHMVVMKAFETIEARVHDLGGRKVFMNSIPSQTLGDEGHALLMRQYKHLFPHIVVEITEAENNAPIRLSEKVNFIRSTGMKIAVDDFGSGYSNEIRILSVDPDIVKIDMELVQGIHKDEDKRNLVENLVHFCKNKGVQVIAEGVEDIRDLAMLVHMKIDYVQGFYVGHPAREMTEINPQVKQEIVKLQEHV